MMTSTFKRCIGFGILCLVSIGVVHGAEATFLPAFPGDLDDIRIFRCALTEQQIANLREVYYDTINQPNEE